MGVTEGKEKEIEEKITIQVPKVVDSVPNRAKVLSLKNMVPRKKNSKKKPADLRVESIAALKPKSEFERH